MLMRFDICGHTGRENDPPPRGAKELAFIRVAEARGLPVMDWPGRCPDCRRAGGS